MVRRNELNRSTEICEERKRSTRREHEPLVMRAVLFTGSTAILVLSTAALQGISHDESRDQQRIEASANREALKPRDDEEKALAAFFASYRDSSGPLKAGDIAGIGPMELGPPPPRPLDDFGQLTSAVCEAEAIVSGRGTISRVFFNERETFLITTYAFRPDQWLRPLNPARQTTNLRVALAGGEALIDGKTTKAFGPAQLRPGQPVVLWLRKVWGTSIYVLASQVGVLRFEGNSIRTAFPTRIAIFQAPESRANVFTAITNAAAICKGQDQATAAKSGTLPRRHRAGLDIEGTDTAEGMIRDPAVDSGAVARIVRVAETVSCRPPGAVPVQRGD
jgi:hypothetical protein